MTGGEILGYFKNLTYDAGPTRDLAGDHTMCGFTMCGFRPCVAGQFKNGQFRGFGAELPTAALSSALEA